MKAASRINQAFQAKPGKGTMYPSGNDAFLTCISYGGDFCALNWRVQATFHCSHSAPVMRQVATCLNISWSRNAALDESNADNLQLLTSSVQIN